VRVPVSEPEVVIAIYRARPGCEEQLRTLIARHVPTLRAAGLVTDRPVTWLRSMTDGAWVEIFEWASVEAARAAHDHPEVGELWRQMGEAAEFPPLARLAEADRPFAHFRPDDPSAP